MSRFFSFVLSCVLLTGVVFAKNNTAYLQIVHNAADPAANEVDVYVNGDLLLDNFKFRTATPFVSVPAEVTLNIGVAPATSSSSAEIIKTISVELEKNKNYIAFANGVVGTGFSANPDGRDIGFTLFAKGDARKNGKGPHWVDLFVLHGSTDAPAVDVIARGVATLVDDAAYGDITKYLRVKPKNYILDITPGNDNNTVVASFAADLRSLGGGAAGVFASGFLNPTTNNNGPAFGLFAVFPDGNVIELPAIKPMARLQVVHNAADPAAAEVDVYVNGDLLLDNFAFRTATPFIDVPAGVTLNVGVAPATSTSSADIIKTVPVILDDGGSYIAFANGIVGANFAANPDKRDIAFTVFAKGDAREMGQKKHYFDFFVLHGSTDAPTVDVIARDVATLVDDAAYGDITDYLQVKPQKYILDITPGNDNKTIVASFEADLSGLGGVAAAVFASGFLNPANNNSGPAFGLYAVLPDGTVIGLPTAPLPPPTARLQVIHNAADPAAKKVDIYVNGDRLLRKFKFRTATPFIDVPAEVELTVGVAPGGSKSANDIIAEFPVTLAKNGTYIVFANGVLGDNFAPNPDGRTTGFTLFTKAAAREAGTDANSVDFFVLHGSTDAPTVDVIARDVAKLVDNAAYGDITPYIQVPAAIYTLDITPGNDNNTIVASFKADLSGLGGGAAAVFASGFFNPEANNNGSRFGLYAALANGQVIRLPMMRKEHQTGTASLQVVHNAADPLAAVVDVYVNGDLFLDDFVFGTATPFVDVPSGVTLNIGVAPATSISANDIIKTIPVKLSKNGTYIAFANGVVGDNFAKNPDDRDIGFTLFAKSYAREQGKGPHWVDLFVLHGSTDAPAVDVIARDVATLVDDAAYGDITNYFRVKPKRYILDITPAKDNKTIVASFEADLGGLGGGAAAVFASGFLSPAGNNDGPAFGLFAVFADGTVIELPSADSPNALLAKTEFGAESAIADRFELVQNYPNPFNPTTKIRYSIPETSFVSLKVYDVSGREIANLVEGRKGAGIYEVDFDGLRLSSGVYFYVIKAGSFSAIKRMTLVK